MEQLVSVVANSYLQETDRDNRAISLVTFLLTETLLRAIVQVCSGYGVNYLTQFYSFSINSFSTPLSYYSIFFQSNVLSLHTFLTHFSLVYEKPNVGVKGKVGPGHIWVELGLPIYAKQQ